MFGKLLKSRLIVVVVVAFAAVAAYAFGNQPTPGSEVNARYATDAYPGFDNEEEIVSPERKEPKWFSFWNGPDKENARDQLAYCIGLLKEGEFKQGAKQLDALVREWPTSPEAPKAQQAYAETLLTKLDETIDAFAEYRYLLDFYSSSCNYAEVADKLYQVACLMREEGKEVMFVRFENTVDVRRAFETCVLRAPGAKWVPEALLTIGRLREDEGRYVEAVKVYENLRNLHPDSEEAKVSYLREAEDRMIMVHEWGYNRSRCRDTIGFLKLALRGCREEDAAAIKEMLSETEAWLENEAYAGAKFYDSPTRTKRSAINAYEKFLKEYPDCVHADEIRRRIEELKGAAQ